MNTYLPSRLYSPAPGWTVSADVIVVGSGVAGLSAALRLRTRVGKVLLVTKTVLSSGSTLWAQGGVAAALDATDSPQAHLADTLAAGGGLCSDPAVHTLVTDGPQRIRDLVALGAKFDLGSSGEFSLTREGGHHADRIIHAGGDATGAEISRALVAALKAVQDDPGIEILEHALVLDVLTGRDAKGRKRAAGVTLHVIGEGSRDGVGAAVAPVVVLATGGLGQIYTSTTNPREATADGMAAGIRAGARVADMEFVQFHPTVLWLGSTSRGQQSLISEAVRGEGAHLLNNDGQRFMVGQHAMAELAPRDVVSKAIVREMARTNTHHVWLDARHLGGAFINDRFPTISSALAQYGFDMGEDLIPVAPAQHFHSGGIAVDGVGQSTLPGLFAVGEVACTGVHGANRLASNSLLEGLVFGHRMADFVGEHFQAGHLSHIEPEERHGQAGLLPAVDRAKIQHATTTGSGVIREATGLSATLDSLHQLMDATKAQRHPHPNTPGDVVAAVAEWETTNMHNAASVLTEAALLREETRGGHYRQDFPDTDDAHWRQRIHLWRDDDGQLQHQMWDINQAPPISQEG